MSTKKYPELQRHIEARQTARRIQLRARDIVDAKTAGGNEPDDLVEPCPTRVVDLQRTPRREAACRHCEDNGIEHCRVASIERAIDEDAAVVVRGGVAGRDYLACGTLPSPGVPGHALASIATGLAMSLVLGNHITDPIS